MSRALLGELSLAVLTQTQVTEQNDHDTDITQQSQEVNLLCLLSSLPFLADFLPSFGKTARNPWCDPSWSACRGEWGTKGTDTSGHHYKEPLHHSAGSLQGPWKVMQRGSLTCIIRGQSQRILRSKSQSYFRAQEIESSRESKLVTAGFHSWGTVTFSLPSLQLL